MYYNMFLALLLLLHLVTARPQSGHLAQDNADSVQDPATLVQTSALSSSITQISLLPTSSIASVQTSTTPSFLVSTTSHVDHPQSSSQSVSQLAPLITTESISQLLSVPTSVQSIAPAPHTTPHAAPLATPTQSPITAPQFKATPPASSHSAPPSSIFHFESTWSLPRPITPAPSSPPIAGTSITPTIRYALIAIIGGTPVLIVLGLIITLRWRRARRRGYRGSQALGEDSILASPALPAFKESKGSRLSSFFGVGHGDGGADRDGRKERRQAYATSVHSSSGLAGVGAHRGAKDYSTPPMVQYAKVLDIGTMSDTVKKPNFENPFGTPPSSGFVIAPSRVSPHIPQTPPPHLVSLPNLLRSNSNPSTTPRSVISQKGAQQLKAPPPAHVRFRPTLPSSALGSFPPYPPANVRTPRSQPVTNLPRIWTSTSVYAGMASPPAPPYAALTPEQTPVLPYLASPGQSPQRQQSTGPVIVIQAASPTLDSDSEYDPSEIGDDVGELEDDETPKETTSDGHAPARPAGMTASPSGFVVPSSTFSSASSYSVEETVTSPSSSASSLHLHEPSALSALALSASSSDDSTVTVTAATMRSESQPQQPSLSADEDRTTPQADDDLSWLPRNFEELERGGRAKV